MPELAKRVIIDQKAGKVWIDGTEFGYYLEAEGPTYSKEQGKVSVVWLPVLTEELIDLGS